MSQASLTLISTTEPPPDVLDLLPCSICNSNPKTFIKVQTCKTIRSRSTYKMFLLKRVLQKTGLVRAALSARTFASSAGSAPIETVPLAYDHFKSPKEGRNSPIVIAHGLFGSKLNNRTVAKQLAELLNRDVFCIDLRNHGDSPHINRHDYPSMAADIERFLETHNLEKPILIGHSMGAKAMMATALRCPDLPKYLIPVDNAPVSKIVSGGSKFAVYIRSLKEITEGRSNPVGSRTQADEVLQKVEPSLPIRQFLLTNVTRKTKQELIEEFEANKKSFGNDLHNVPVFRSKIPLDIVGKAIDSGNIAMFPFDSKDYVFKGNTLFIRGTDSTFVPDDVLPDIGRYFPRFEVKDVKAGHWLISENPKEFVETVRDWVEYREEADSGEKFSL